MRLKLKLIVGVLTGVFCAGTASADITIGVSSPRGEAQATAEWSEFVRYLETKAGQPVTLVPVAVAKMDQLIADKRVDFAICNPVQAVAMSQANNMPLIASLVQPNGAQFGGVIIANPKAGIAKITDLKGKKIMALNSTAAGAYLFQAYEALKAGLKVPQDFGQIVEVKKQDDIVLAVKAGVMDAGFIRTGILESMIKENKIAEGDVVIVERKPGFPLIVSTPLYPEWYMISVTNDSAKTAKIKPAALALTPDDPAAKAAKIKGFSEPLDHAPVQAMMKAMKVPPFNQ